GLPIRLLRGFALLARAAGILGQLAEEERMPVGMDMYLAVEHNAEFVDPSEVVEPVETTSPDVSATGETSSTTKEGS
ncbi:MAG: hypothetical protein J2O46_10130, partial [Nocardioides sp.]|nr:hypothetical protein [Nocardioides sp.]